MMLKRYFRWFWDSLLWEGAEYTKNPKEGQYGQSKVSKAEWREGAVRAEAGEHLGTGVKSLGFILRIFRRH